MLSQAKIKQIKQLHHKRGRQEHGLCLVEGEKLVSELQDKLLYTFTPADTEVFHELVTTTTPQQIAGVAKIPEWSLDDVQSRNRIVLLDGVQDPGNVGAIARLCQAFAASMILVNAADMASPKVIRSSAGAVFHIPWRELTPTAAEDFVKNSEKSVYRMEQQTDAIPYARADLHSCILIAGSEGRGISLNTDSPSLFIPHEKSLESLNVAQAVGIVLARAYS